MSSSSSRRNVLTLLAAFLGWLFDGFEMGMFPLIGQPALKDLLGAAASFSAGSETKSAGCGPWP